MATSADTPSPDLVRSRSRRSSGLSRSFASYALIAPAVVGLVLFFLVPLVYIFEFSVGLKWFAHTKALATIDGEATGFTTSLWTGFFAPLRLEILPNLTTAGVTIPLGVAAIAFAALILGAAFGTTLPRYGGIIAATCFVVLLAPTLTFPAGNTLIRFARISSNSIELRLFFKSTSMAMTASVAAVLIAFPVAYFLAFCVQKTKYFWLLIVITPFLTSYLLRIFAWKIILGDQGLINSGLASLGLIDRSHPLSFLIYSQFPVMVVLTYAWVPFICLPIFISLEIMDRRLLEAATDLGASRLRAFVKITLPLAAPGIVAAFLFVFIPTIGEFITPSLVGGTSGYMFGQAIYDSFLSGAFDWQGGSVLALFLLAVVLFLTATTSKFLRAGGGAS